MQQKVLTVVMVGGHVTAFLHEIHALWEVDLRICVHYDTERFSIRVQVDNFQTEGHHSGE